MPLIGADRRCVDADDPEVTFDRMTEEELLNGLEGLVPPEEQPEEERIAPRALRTARFRRAIEFDDDMSISLAAARST